MIPLAFLSIAALLLVVAALSFRARLVVAALFALGLGNAYAGVSPVAQRSKLLDSVAAISATETDTTIHDLRGLTNISFVFLATLNTGFSTGSVFFKGSILGCDSQTGTFVPIPSLETAELVVDVGQVLPTAATAAGIVLPRFIKVKWTETGAMTSFTATCRMWYDVLATGPGRQADHGYQGG